MALGYTTYKTPNAIYLLKNDLTGKEGCGVKLLYGDQGKIDVATTTTDVPYAVVTVGGASEDGTYPGPVAQSSLEVVDQLGCVVQVSISVNGGVNAGDFLVIDPSEANGTFTSSGNITLAVGDWLWGYALTTCQPGEQCVMRFQPQYFFSTYVPPAP